MNLERQMAVLSRMLRGAETPELWDLYFQKLFALGQQWNAEYGRPPM